MCGIPTLKRGQRNAHYAQTRILTYFAPEAIVSRGSGTIDPIINKYHPQNQIGWGYAEN